MEREVLSRFVGHRRGILYDELIRSTMSLAQLVVVLLLVLIAFGFYLFVYLFSLGLDFVTFGHVSIPFFDLWFEAIFYQVHLLHSHFNLNWVFSHLATLLWVCTHTIIAWKADYLFFSISGRTLSCCLCLFPKYA